MEYKQLRATLFDLLRDRQFAAAEALLQSNRPESGVGLGRWSYLYALFLRRVRPADREALDQVCGQAARLLATVPAEVCGVYQVQLAAAISNWDWAAARTYALRIRSFMRRYPDDREVQAWGAGTVYNEGLIERAAGFWAVAARRFTAAVDRFAKHPHWEEYRLLALIEAASVHLMLGEHKAALPLIAAVPKPEAGTSLSSRYAYVQTRYWISLGAAARAQEWLSQVHDDWQEWDQFWPALTALARADVAGLQQDAATTRTQLRLALAAASGTSNLPLIALIQQQLSEIEEVAQ
ncbi:MAG TPA: hypothetical protein VGK74_17790 [Symbiobacteriaceae bacterium]|jgi:hypothetical protein